MCSVGHQRFFRRNGSWAVTLTAEGLSVARPSALSVSWARLPPENRKLRGEELENADFEVAPPLSVPKQQQTCFYYSQEWGGLTCPCQTRRCGYQLYL